MLHAPECFKCGNNARLVSYRRNDGNPTWTCSACAGLAADIQYRLCATYVVKAEVEAPSETFRRPPAPRQDRDEEFKAKYVGFRALHDPLRR